MVSEKQKQLRKRRKRIKRKKILEEETKPVERHRGTRFDRIYHDHYKLLFIITTLMLIAAFAVIGMTYAQTGDILYKGVSLSGGLTITIPTSGSPIAPSEIEDLLVNTFPDADFAVREVSELGTQSAIVIEGNRPGDLSVFEDEVLAALAGTVDVSDASTEIVGPSLGQSFFKQVAKAVLIALVFMGLVVFLYFGETKAQKIIVTLLAIIEGMFIWNATGSIIFTILAIILGIIIIVLYVRFSIPSAAVILAAVSTIVFTLAVINVMELRVSTAGIAAFLMLIGYSVDTDILLSTRVLKRSGGTVYDRVLSTVKTGLTMEVTTMITAVVALVFSQSEVIREIMLIIFIGLLADIFFTWIQNVGILRWHLERRGSK